MITKIETKGALALEPSGVVVILQVGKDRYRQLSAARLKSARLAVGWDQARLAEALGDVLDGEAAGVTAHVIETWENGSVDFSAAILPAAYDVMGILEVDVIALGNPDVAVVKNLAVAVARVRVLLADPVALSRRLNELMEGTAKPLL